MKLMFNKLIFRNKKVLKNFKWDSNFWDIFKLVLHNNLFSFNFIKLPLKIFCHL